MTKSRDLGNLAQTVATSLPTALGTAGQTLLVNSGATALEFADAATGGGGGSLEATASGALANGDKVVINTDGTVSVVSETTPTESLGSPTVFESAASFRAATVYDANAQRIVIAYIDEGNNDRGTAVVGEVSGTTITFGTPVIFSDQDTDYPCITYDATNQKVVIGYQDFDATKKLSAVVGTVTASSNSISFGTEVQTSISNAFDISAVYDANAQKVVFAYRDGSNSNYGTAVVATVSGTSISFGSGVVFNSGISYEPKLAYDENAQKVVVFYRDSSVQMPYAKVGTVSGTSISFGSAAGTDDYSYEHGIVYAANAQKVVVFYRDSGNSSKGTYRIGTISGTSITFSTGTVFHQGNGKNYSATYDANAEKITIAFFDASNSNYGTLYSGTVGASSITFGSATVFEQAEVSLPTLAYDSSNAKVVIGYEDVGNTQYGTAIVFQNAGGSVTNLTAENYIGISDAAYSDTATATIQIAGSVDDAQSGLTAGKAYYVQTDGTLSTTPDSPSVFAGTAVSSTKLIVKG